MNIEIQNQTLGQSEQKPTEVPLRKAITIIVVSLILAIGTGVFVGKKFFWNQYEQIPVVDRQITRLLSEIQKDPAKPDKYIELGDMYLERKEWLKAEEAFKNALKVEPKGTRAQYNLAVTYIMENRHQDAFKILEPLAVQYPNLDYVQFNTGVTEFNLGKYEQAVSYLQSAAKLQPGGADIWYYLGQAYEKTGNVFEAAKSYEKALSLYPGYKDAQDSLNRVRK
jgi:tetratricopeptide (TPR) repeat protein